MYNYAVFGDVNELINDIVSAFPANEAMAFKKEIYNDINFNNMLKANEASIDENTGVGKLLEIMMKTVDANMDTNFAYISRSKGDVTKLKDFHTINASISYINKLATDYNYATDKHNVSTRFKANNISRMNDIYDILKSHRNDFIYGYRIDSNVIKNTYCTLVCILIDLTCLNMVDITDFMENITEHDLGDRQSTLPWKTTHSIARNGRYLNNVDKYIKIFHDGSWNKLYNIVRNKHGRVVTEDTAAIGIIIALIGAIPIVAVMIIYLIRFFISFYFETAVNIKQKASSLGSYIEEVSKSEEDPRALYRQNKAVRILRNITNFINSKILKEDAIGMNSVEVADRNLREEAYVSNNSFNQLANGNIAPNSEIQFE